MTPSLKVFIGVVLLATASFVSAAAQELKVGALSIDYVTAEVQDDKASIIAQCDLLAASDLDSERPASVPGVPPNEIDVKMAVPACEAAVKVAHDDRRIIFQLGRAYATAKQFEQALVQYIRADELGSLLAANDLGTLYKRGLGGPPDLIEARRHYEKAAAGGLSIAMKNLGWMHEHGWGGPSDYASARWWYEKAAGLEHAPAMTSMARLYYYGRGVLKDLAETRRWLERGVAGGDAEAMYDLGFLSARGEGAPIDLVEARRWFEEAAARGNFAAMTGLGLLYYMDNGLPRDYSVARSRKRQRERILSR